MREVGPILARGVGAALFAPSVTGARGRGVTPDLCDPAESGDIIEERWLGALGGGDLAVDDESVPCLAGAPGPAPAVREPGARDSLRFGADGVADAPFGLAGGGMEVLCDAMEDEDVGLRREEVACGLEDAAVVAVLAPAAGAVRVAPVPTGPWADGCGNEGTRKGI